MRTTTRFLPLGLVWLSFIGCGGDDEQIFAPATSSTAVGSGGSGGDGASGGSGAVGPGGSGGVAGSGGMGGGTGGMAGMGGAGPCGDGNVDYASGERCDDGNTMGGDGCSASCAIEAAASCGNGTLDLVSGEECDDGNTAAGDGCSPACQLEPVGQSCGDGQLQAGEACDDSNVANGDGCNPTCNFTNTTTLFAGSPGVGGLVDGIGVAARIGGVSTMTIDAVAIYLGDGGNSAVRRIDVATAAVLTIAGGTGQGYVDSPLGANAQFGSVEAVATDGSTVWVADAVNHRIRAVSTTAPYATTTAAGSATQGHVDGIGPAAQLDGIRGLTFYGGFVYFVDGTAGTLRRLDPATSEVITLAGQPYVMGQANGFGTNATFISPRYMTSDGTGMLYIADTNGNQIRAYNTVTTEVTTFAGAGACGYADGQGSVALIHRPRGMTSDGSSVYWVEFNAHTVRQGILASGLVSTMLGTPPPCTVDCSCPMAPAGSYVEGVGSAALFDGPFSVAYHYPSSSLFVMDSGNFVIRRVQ